MFFNIIPESRDYRLVLSLRLTINLWMVCGFRQYIGTNKVEECGKVFSGKLRSFFGEERVCYAILHDQIVQRDFRN